jgi:hypothetical protein
MKYKDIKYDYKNTKRCVLFKLIEEVKVYNEGMMFAEYTRFYGDQMYVIYDNEGNIQGTYDENEATVFFSDEEAQNVYLQIIDKIKSNEIEYDGILVIEYNELHAREWEVLQYPNRNYPDSIQPISIYKGHSRTKYEANERRNRYIRAEMYDKLIGYIESRGWKLTNDDIDYLNSLNYYSLENILLKNRGSNNLRLFKR